VTVASTGTANDQLARFDLYINSFSLTNTSGDRVSLISSPINAEFMGVNGDGEPLFTTSIPRATYTSATMSVMVGAFECVTLGQSGGLIFSTFAVQNEATDVTVDVPSPLEISGSDAVLALDLLVSKSASWTTCDPNGIQPFSITPTLDLTAMTLSSQPSNSQNGLESGLGGLITTVSATSGSFTVMADDGQGCAGTDAGANCSPPAAYAPTWQVATDSSTVYDGVVGISQLVPGMGVEMDAGLQPDGSLLAKRVWVYDSDADNLTVAHGPLVFNSLVAGYESLEMSPVRELGPLALAPITFSYSAAVFQISGGFTNLSELPFAPNFGAANAVDGQNVYATTHALQLSIPPVFVPATSITLIPQTIDGTVGAIGSEGGFTTYTVTLAPYDLFPALAVQPGQTTLLTDPNTVVVYADANTQMLNTSPLAVGSVVRFYGLVFNDNGALRMDCAQINDGVAE
jgi:hypothetical protein